MNVPTADSPARFEVHPDVVTQEMGDQLVLVHLGTNRIHSLNSTAVRLWSLLSENRSRDEIERRLSAEFEIEPATLSEDVGRALDQLADAELIARAVAD